MNATKLNRDPARRNAKKRSWRRQTSVIEQLEQRNLMAVLDSFLTNEHADISLGYGAETWSLHASDRDNFVLHETEDVLIYTGAPATNARVAGSAFDFIGVESGEDFYRLPQSQDPELLYLGIAGDGARSGDFDRYNPSAESKGRVSGLGRWLKASLVDVQHTTPSGAVGDGEFSVWQSGDVGPVVFISSYDDGVPNPNGSGVDTTDGIGPDDAFWVTAGGHLHFNYGFTQKGRYEISFTLSSYLNDGNTTSLGQFTESEPLTVYFSVGSVGQLEFDAATYTVNEDAGEASITLRRVNGSDGQITVDYATSDGSAETDADYLETSGTLTFEDQETSKIITIPILNDDVDDPDETVQLMLSNPGPSSINDYLIDVETDANGLLGEQVTATLAIVEVDDPGGTIAARDDAYTVRDEKTLYGNVTLNDKWDESLGEISTSVVTTATKGSLALRSDGSFTYVPSAEFNGTDSFSYQLSNLQDDVATAIVTITAAGAQDFDTVLQMGHADVGVAYEDGWDLHVHDEENEAEYEPAEVLLYAGPQAEAARLEDATFEFIGVAAGETYWRLPEVDNPELLFLGIGGEEIEDGTFQGGEVQLQLKAVNGPGQFSLWQNTDTGPDVAMATSDGITADDSLSVLEGGHAHYNWGFSALGGYEVTFEATGTLADGTAVASGDVTYFFEVNGAPAAADDTFTVGLGNHVRGNVLFNDTDPDGDALTAALSTEPTKGTVVLEANGSFTYLPDGSFGVSDSFSYTVSDDSGESHTAIVTITATAPQDFETTLTNEHVDVGIAYGSHEHEEEEEEEEEEGHEEAEWDLHVHDETNDAEHEPGEALLFVGPQAETARPEEAAFDFIGVAAGESYWRLPDTANPELLFLGIGAEEIEDGTFQSGQIRLQLKAVSGPGQFSLWQNTDTGPEVAMATSDGITVDDSASVLEGGHAHYNWGFTARGRYEVSFEAVATLPDGDVVRSGDVTYTFSVAPPLLSVSALDSSSSGLVASFSGDLDAANLNLFGTEAHERGASDVTLVGSTVGSVAGSLVVDPTLRQVSFIKAGGPLEPDTYTVTMRSAADGFVDVAGRLLDGNRDGMEGGDLVETFTITEPAAATITLGVPDLVRGPGQPVNVPATAAGLPISISDGEDVRTVDLRIAYDPSLLSITGAAVAAGVPDGSSVTVNIDTPGLAMIAFASPSPLATGPQTLINLDASIPADDPSIIGRMHRLDVHGVTIRDGSGNSFPVRVDDGLQFVGYFGDVSGNGRINAGDASQVARFAALIDTGFDASFLTDPVILADISGNGRVNAADASLIAQFAALLDVPEIPPLPAQAAAARSGVTAKLHPGNSLDQPNGVGRGVVTEPSGGSDSNCDSIWGCFNLPAADVDTLMADSSASTTDTDESRSEDLEVAMDELFGTLDEMGRMSS